MQHFDNFIELDKLVNKSLIIYKSEYEIKGAYIHNESEFKLLSDYFAIGKTHTGKIEIANNYFRGEPDWYFLEGEDGGIDYPATWNFQTLSERKAEFQKFCDHLKELEMINDRILLIWNVFTDKPDIIRSDRPYTMRCKYFGINSYYRLRRCRHELL